MTIRGVLSAMGRRWYVVLAVFTLAGAGLAYFADDGGSYATRTIVSFTWPDATLLQAQNGNTDDDVIAFAGAVATEINNGRAPQTYSESDAPYYGAGIREGYVVALQDLGNQWHRDFSRAQIEIQIVGRTHEWVEITQRRLVEAVVAVADAQQDRAMVPLSERITASIVPLTQDIDHVLPGRMSQIAACAAMLFAALIVSASAAVAVDRQHETKRVRRGARMSIRHRRDAD
ncbi:MAG: hypothetical protein ABS62_12865 [Microbacterium sp. SCN 70-200]|nr:MAG: hypothetical protein ABS62_12865 [Microbacterium sp. SCN 70-200]OJV84339.1 MAG: hypothetical protein BGO46_09665 [Microbacterium sp. 70-16]